MAAPAAIGAARALARVLVGVLLGLLTLALLTVVAVIAFFGHVRHALHGEDQTAVGAPIPPALVAVFNEAARVWTVNPFLLASIAYQESTFGQGAGWQQPNHAGCTGLMQICTTGAGDDSWNQRVRLHGGPVADLLTRDAYRQGRRPDGYPWPSGLHPDIRDSFDNVMAAAVVLRAKVDGQPIPHLDQRAYRAACGYFGACSWGAIDYAPAVIQRARAWQQATTTSGQAIPTTFGEGAQPLSWPVPEGTPVTSPYCERRAWERCHPGIDLAVEHGTTVRAAAGGRVSTLWQAPGGGYGNYLCIEHTATLSTCYAHLQRFAPDIHLGATVSAGQVVGVSDCSGRCYGAHLHFEVRLGPGYGAPTTCPAPFLPPVAQRLCT